MPENEFEKKVASEMMELKFKPSARVWPRVEERIRKKKKRKVFIIIFLLAGLALLGYWQRGNLFGEAKTDLVKIEEPKKENSKPADETTDSSTSGDKAGPEGAIEAYDSIRGITNDKPVTRKQESEKAVVSKTKKGIVCDNKVEQKPEPSVEVALIQKQENIIESTVVRDAVAVNPDQEINKATREETKQTEIKSNENKIDSTKSGVVKEKNATQIKDTVSKKDSVKDSTIIVQKKSLDKKWKWGLQFTPGISSLSDQNFSLGMAKSADANYLQSPAGSGTGGPAPAPPPQPAPPSDHKTGFAFQLGGFLQRQITGRSSLSIGLQYGYYSEHIKLGSKNDTALRNLNFSSADAGSYYSAGNTSQDYTNKYHFIEVAMNYHLQLNKNKSKPLTWDIGFFGGQLIGTNAVMYDTASRGIYYKNTSLLNKTQFSLATGFSWTVVNNQDTRWTIGPVLNLHLNSFLDNPFEDKKYLFFTGLRSSLIFNAGR